MKIRYSPHAVQRMVDRNVSTGEVEDLLLNPDDKIRQSRDKIIAYKRVRGRQDNMLAVVAVEQRGQFEIGTVLVNFEVQQ